MDEAAPLVFVDADGRFEVVMMPEAIGAMVAAAKQAGRKETGGILIGRLDAGGGTAIVLEATAKPADSGSGWAWFRRGVRGLRSLLAYRWQEGRHYLGEWHYHPGSSPAPSGPDREAIAAIARDGRYQCPEPILSIIGGSPTRWQFFVGVSPNGEGLRSLSARSWSMQCLSQ
jgi:hypothetical protein